MAIPEERIRIEMPGGETGGAFATPPDPAAVLVVAHGAGGTMDSPFLAGFTRSVNEAGLATLRFNFAYAERGRRAPDAESKLRGAWVAAFDEAADRTPGLGVFAGGKSLGGRIASVGVADGELAAAGLVFLGYPLHPPGKPDRIRDEHLYRIEAPMLFLQGTADPFARSEVLEPVLRRLGRRAAYRPIDGGDHSFRVRGAKRDDREIGASLGVMASAFVHDAVGR
jgi:predicted alpha/beta-hydrolase family hydrolase